MTARVLIVAGSDSGGGAGIQADIKTVTALGGFAMTAITALTAQNTKGVTGVLPVDPVFIREQMERVIEDIGIDAVKTGMLHDAPVIEVVTEVLKALKAPPPIVCDPVMIAQSGDPLIDPKAVSTLSRRLPRIATLLTPNIPEAEKLSGMNIAGVQDMVRAANKLVGMGYKNVLLKGGHLEGQTMVDALATSQGVELLEGERIDTDSLHGTGCTLASAITTGLAQGLTLRDAVVRGRAYLLEAIRTAPGLGGGGGPLNHGHTVGKFPA